jgi:16S rRNA (cytidine1402-2'-O)-methyltransferase
MIRAFLLLSRLAVYFSMMLGKLYLVATPIGNLQDISLRAIETLKSVDLVACEDTRHTGKLLKHLGIKQKLISYHEHNEHLRADELADLLRNGKSIAVVSDAGTPGIADPSFRIVQRAHDFGADVIPIPGAVAFVNASIVSGLPADSLFFGGFLPSKKGERRKRLAEIKGIPATLALYETPHRVAKSLVDCFEILGDRNAAVVRELTKLHEEVIRGTLSELVESFSNQTIKGEIVLIIERANLENSRLKLSSDVTISKRVAELEADGQDHKSALKTAAKEFGLSKSVAYKKLISERR